VDRRHDRAGTHAPADLTRAREDSAMERPSFVYTSYIKTTPELLWRALTEPAFTSRYWNTTFETDWEVGSAMTWINHGVTISDPAQVVLEADPYRRLSYTWHTFTPELGERFSFDDELVSRAAKERRSKATFEIEPLDDQVRLTITHDDFDPDSPVLGMISNGWPRVVSDLKTMLETDAAVALT
jgi:uncharacterized protein YndB with AHSA1/START domain